MEQLISHISPVYRPEGWPLRIHVVGGDSPEPVELLRPREPLLLQELLEDPLEPGAPLLDPRCWPRYKPFIVVRTPLGTAAELSEHGKHALTFAANGIKRSEAGSGRSAGTIQMDLNRAADSLGARSTKDAIVRAFALGLLDMPRVEREIAISGRAVHVLGLMAMGVEGKGMRPYVGLSKTMADRYLAAAYVAFQGKGHTNTMYTLGQACATGLIVVGRPYTRDRSIEETCFRAVKPGSFEERLGETGKAAIIAAYEGGKSGAAIAKEYGISSDNVLRLLGDWRCRRPPRERLEDRLGPERKAAMIADFQAGVQQAKISRKYGLSSPNVTRLLQRWGCTPPQKPKD